MKYLVLALTAWMAIGLTTTAVGQTDTTGQHRETRGGPPGAGHLQTTAQTIAQKADEQLLYLVVHSAVDCPFCKVWRQSSTGLAAAEQLQRSWPDMRLVIIDRSSVNGSETETLYPKELRSLYDDRRARYQLSPPTPMFELVFRNKVISRATGMNGWTDQVLPELNKIKSTWEAQAAPAKS